MRPFLKGLCVAAVFLASEAVASAAPDLVIDGAWPTGLNSVVVRVRNQGNSAAGACTLAMRVHQHPSGQYLGGWYYRDVPPLNAGQFTYVTLVTPNNVTVSAMRRLYFRIDFGGIIAESNEANNSFTRIVP